jgi:pimeloyl-ACP methyl ester carboxylesterase
MGFFQLPALPEALLTARDGLLLRRSLRRSGLPAEVADRYVDRQLQPGALRASLGWYRALPLDARDPIGPVAVDTLHVWGARDPFIGRAATEACAAHVRGPYRLEVLEDAGHWLPELHADRVAELVTAHVRRA